MDETGQMHRNFRIMISRINDLINENYRKQLAMKESEYKKSLQAQINPHFLYNTLESINWQAKVGGQKQISQMVEALAYLMRSSINERRSRSSDWRRRRRSSYIILPFRSFASRVD